MALKQKNSVKSSVRGRKVSPLLSILIIAVVVLMASVAIYALKDSSSADGTIPATTSTESTKKPTKPDKEANGSVNTTPQQAGPTQSTPTTQTNVILDKPSGNFVSNHFPGQHGTSLDEQSVCNTTPGAYCNIIFTNSDGISKDLGKKLTDANGAVFWGWNINSAGLSTGSWKVTAVAELGGQTSTAEDVTALKVQ